MSTGVTVRGAQGATLKRAAGYDGVMFNVAKDGALTLGANLTLDGERRNLGEVDRRGTAVNVLGSLRIDGATITHEMARGGVFAAPVRATGEHARITLVSGKVADNDFSEARTAYAAGAIALADGASMVMEGGEISGNRATTYRLQGLVWSDSPGAGGIMVGPGCSFTMNGGTIAKNEGWGGGVLVGSADPYQYDRRKTDEAELKPQKLATAVFNAGTIEGNQAVGGGGISGNGNVDISFPEGSSVRVAGNRAYQVGGVFISDWAVDGIGLDKEITKLPIEAWQRHYAGRFVMAGGEVVENASTMIGGGVLVSSNGVELMGGRIANNRAGDYGGGVAVSSVPYTLRIKRAYIGGNQADGSRSTSSDGVFLPARSGGGLWFCPTGHAVLHVEDGVTVAENAAARAGDELWSSPKLAQDGYSVTLAERLPNGSALTYYKDGSGARYTAPGERVDVTDVRDELAVKAVGDADGLRTARSLARLEIVDNHASKGGGVGSNGSVIFGTEPTGEHALKEVELVKTWGEGATPGPVTVELRARLNDADWLIERVELNADNGYRAMVKGLPATVAGAPIEDVLYAVETAGGDGYVTTVGKPQRQPGKTLLSFAIERPGLSDIDNAVAAYTNYAQAGVNPEIFDEDAWELKDFAVSIDVAIEDGDTRHGEMRYTADTFSWEGKVSFKDIPIDAKDVRVVYDYDGDHFELPSGAGYYSPAQLVYTLRLSKAADGAWELHVPGLLPYTKWVDDANTLTGAEQVLQVKDLQVAEPSAGSFVITVHNEVEKPPVPEEPGKPGEPEEPTPDKPGKPDKPEEPRQPDKPSKPEEPGAPEQPGTPQEPEKPSKPQQPAPAQEKPQAPTLPATGDTAWEQVAAACALACAALGVWYSRIRRAS